MAEVAMTSAFTFHVELLVILFFPRSQLAIDIVVDSGVGYIHLVGLLLRSELLLIIGVADRDNLVVLLHRALLEGPGPSDGSSLIPGKVSDDLVRVGLHLFPLHQGAGQLLSLSMGWLRGASLPVARPKGSFFVVESGDSFQHSELLLCGFEGTL